MYIPCEQATRAHAMRSFTSTRRRLSISIVIVAASVVSIVWYLFADTLPYNSTLPHTPQESPEKYEITTANGVDGKRFKMAIHPYNDIISRMIKTSGAWEPHLCSAIVSVFKRFSHLHHRDNREIAFLDIGGNIGFHSLCAATLPEHLLNTIITVEASHKNFGALHTSMKLNGWESRMSLVNMAVSNGADNTPLCFRVDSSNMGGNSAVNPANHPTAKWHSGIECEYVPVTTIDSILQSTAGNRLGSRTLCPLVMKLDIEGYEHRALEGAHRLLNNYSPCAIFMELHVVLLKAANAAPVEETLLLLLNAGYKPVSHTMDNLKTAIATGGQLDVKWEHATINDSNHDKNELSCWNRCINTNWW